MNSWWNRDHLTLMSNFGLCPHFFCMNLRSMGGCSVSLRRCQRTACVVGRPHPSHTFIATFFGVATNSHITKRYKGLRNYLMGDGRLPVSQSPLRPLASPYRAMMAPPCWPCRLAISPRRKRFSQGGALPLSPVRVHRHLCITPLIITLHPLQ